VGIRHRSGFLLLYGMRMAMVFDIWHPHELLDRTIGLCLGITAVTLLFLARKFIRCTKIKH
jgi:hypothetical protein